MSATAGVVRIGNVWWLISSPPTKKTLPFVCQSGSSHFAKKSPSVEVNCSIFSVSTSDFTCSVLNFTNKQVSWLVCPGSSLSKAMEKADNSKKEENFLRSSNASSATTTILISYVSCDCINLCFN